MLASARDFSYLCKMKTKSAYSIIIIVLSLFFTNCYKDNNEYIIPANPLTVENDLTELRFSEGVRQYTFGISAKCDWRIRTYGEGFTVEPTKGSEGTFTITVRCDPQTVPAQKQQLGSFDIAIDHSAVRHRIRIEELPRSQKTVIAYFLGTSLSYFFNGNIEAMKRAVAADFLGNDRLIMLSQSGQYKASIDEIFYDKINGKSCRNTIETITLPDKLTASSFSDNLKRMMEIAPSDSYSLIVLGHSKSWLPSTVSATTFGLHRRPSWSTVENADVTRDLGERNTLLELGDLKNGLDAAGKKFDCIYFDVCFMASLEAAYALRDNTDYIVGSPCEIMGYGSPYDRILAPLFSDNFEKVCFEYCDFYRNEYSSWKSGCISTIVCSELDEVADITRRINISSTSPQDFDITDVQPYEGRNDHIFFDAEDYIQKICTDTELSGEYETALSKCVINRNHTAGFYSAYNYAMTAIKHYSGINTTPDEKCIDAISANLKTLETDYTAKCTERDRLKAELETQGKDPSSSEEYNTIAREAYKLQEQMRLLEGQKAILEYYNPSLHLTDWYKATH